MPGTADEREVPGMAEELDADVLVVGAGLAGLGAAYRLAGHGYSVRVLERGPRPGGRIRTVQWQDATVELGAMWFNRGYHRLARLLDELGLARLASGVGDFSVRVRRADRWHELDFGRPGTLLTTSLLTWRDRLSLARWGWEMARIAPTLRRTGLDDLDPVARLDTRGVTDVLTPGATRLLSVMEASLGYQPRDMSFALICGMFGPAMLSPGLAKPITLRGGLGVLVDRLAAGPDVDCSVAVDWVSAAGTGASVVGRDRDGGPVRQQARAVVLATPADVTARIWPDCPPRLLGFLRGVRYSSCTLLHLRTATRYEPTTRAGTPILQEVVPAADRPPGAASGMAFLNGWVPSGGLLMTGTAGPGAGPGTGHAAGHAAGPAAGRAAGHAAGPAAGPAAGRAAGRVAGHAARTVADPVAGSTDEVADRLQADVEGYHPELRGQVVDRLGCTRDHFAPLFGTGYLRSLVALRPGLRPAPVDVAGDYLRSPSMEGALMSGIEAADRVHAHLTR